MFFKHRYITVPEISKADAIVAAAHQLAKTPQWEASKIGETKIQQLRHLVQILQYTTTSSMQKWAHQTSTVIILINHTQPRMEEQPHNPLITRHQIPTGRLLHHLRNQNPYCSHTSHKTMTMWHQPKINQLTNEQKTDLEPSLKLHWIKTSTHTSPQLTKTHECAWSIIT